MIQGLRTVIDKVPDLEAAKAWYARALGFEPYFAEPYDVGFQVGQRSKDPFGNVFGIIENPHFALANVR